MAPVALVDDFGRSVPMRGPIHLVLHGREEFLRRLGIGRVNDAGRVDVEHFLIETGFAGTDVAKAFPPSVK